MRILVLYGTSEGQTRKIAAFVADQLRRREHDVSLVDASQQPPELRLADFDAAVVAARVHASAYQRQIIRFVQENRGVLESIPNAFLSVSMSAANLQPGDMDRAQSYVESFMRKTGWRPRHVLHTAGARLYVQHNPLVRWILGIVDRHQLDTTKDHVWTDWDSLERFAANFNAIIVSGDRSAQPTQPATGTRSDLVPAREAVTN